MRRLTAIFLVFVLILVAHSVAHAVKTLPASALTGGGTGALDRYYTDGESGAWGSYGALAVGDKAVVITSSNIYYLYRMDDSGTAESSPDVIKPDEQNNGTPYTGDLRWKLCKAGIIDDTAGNGDTGKLWSADKIYDQLALKQDTITNPVTSDGATTVENQIPQFTDTNNEIKDSLALVITVGDPGDDTSVPSEQAVREGLNAKESSTSNDFDPDRLAGDTVDDNLIDDGIVAPTIMRDSEWTAASATAQGKVELATAAETSTGTDDARAVTPDGLAGSIYGERTIAWTVYDSDTDVAIADGKQAFTVPASINGFDIVDVIASVHTQGVTGTTDVQIRRRRSGSDMDVLSTKVTIGAEYYASDEVVNTSNDDLATGDQIYIDVDAIHSGTAPKGLSISVTCRLP